jgi:hypothetical protein
MMIISGDDVFLFFSEKKTELAPYSNIPLGGYGLGTLPTRYPNCDSDAEVTLVRLEPE